jgi:hypothetical protein
MKLVLLLICLFIALGLAKRTTTWRTYAAMFMVIVFISLSFIMTSI